MFGRRAAGGYRSIWRSKKPKKLPKRSESRCKRTCECGAAGWGNKRQEEALENIRSIRDLQRAAVAKMFAEEEENDDLRQLLAEVLGRLDSSGAAAVLARGAMEDSNREVHCSVSTNSPRGRGAGKLSRPSCAN